jgi:hypothetical protein
MSYTERFSEVHYPLVSEFPDSMAANTYTSARVSLAKYHRAVLVLSVGDMAAGAKLDVALYQATAASGGSTKAITGKAITQLTQASGDGNDVFCIELQTEELDVTGGYEHVYVVAVVDTDAVEYGWTLFGIQPRYAPVATTNWEERIS